MAHHRPASCAKASRAGSRSLASAIQISSRPVRLLMCTARWRPLGEGVTLTYELIRNLYYEPQNGAGDIYWVDARIIEELRPE